MKYEELDYSNDICPKLNCVWEEVFDSPRSLKRFNRKKQIGTLFNQCRFQNR